MSSIDDYIDGGNFQKPRDIHEALPDLRRAAKKLEVARATRDVQGTLAATAMFRLTEAINDAMDIEWSGEEFPIG